LYIILHNNCSFLSYKVYVYHDFDISFHLYIQIYLSIIENAPIIIFIKIRSNILGIQLSIFIIIKTIFLLQQI